MLGTIMDGADEVGASRRYETTFEGCLNNIMNCVLVRVVVGG